MQRRGPTQSTRARHRAPGPGTEHQGPTLTQTRPDNRRASHQTIYNVLIRKLSRYQAYMQCCTLFEAGHDAAPEPDTEFRGPTQSADTDRRAFPQRIIFNTKINALIRKLNRHQAYMQCCTLFEFFKLSMVLRWRPAQSAGARHRAPGPDTERQGPTQSDGARHRAPGPETDVLIRKFNTCNDAHTFLP